MPEDAPKPRKTPSPAEIDALLTAQIAVAWAGEGHVGEDPRLGWWRSDLVSEFGGQDLFERLLPRTHRWAALQAVREAARRRDAELRAQAKNPDGVISLFRLGFEIDEAVEERLASLKRDGQPPEEALPALADVLVDAEAWDQDAFLRWIKGHGQVETKIEPLGRRLVGERPASLRAQVGHDRRERRWRHLDVGGVRCVLRYSIRRVTCSKCGVKVEQVPWADPDSGFTHAFEELVALMSQKTDKTMVSNLLRIAWLTVGRVIERVVLRYGGDPQSRLRGLRRIGIDELSYRKQHRYVTIVVDLDTHRVVWVAEGKDAAALDGFFEALGPDGVAALEIASIDMSGAFKRALRERAPHVRVVFDRFHVQGLVHDALDQLRRGMVAELREPDEKRALKGTRYALQRSPWRLDAVARRKLDELEKENQPLYRAYLMKEALAAIFDTASPESIHDDLMNWLTWVEAEGEPPLVRAAETIAEHFDGIVAYVEVGLTNAITEGLNRKARVVTSRAYGFRRLASFASMLLLCCGGITLPWPHVLPL